VVEPSDALALGAGDTLVLSGLPEALSLAEAKLLEG
jgi:CPA2 family monovalent cation:H+ antiporter-2